MPLQSIPTEIWSAIFDQLVDPTELLLSCGWMGGRILTAFEVEGAEMTHRWDEEFVKRQRGFTVHL